MTSFFKNEPNDDCFPDPNVGSFLLLLLVLSALLPLLLRVVLVVPEEEFDLFPRLSLDLRLAGDLSCLFIDFGLDFGVVVGVVVGVVDGEGEKGGDFGVLID